MAVKTPWKQHVRKAISKIKSGKSTGVGPEKFENIEIKREIEKTISSLSRKAIKPKPLFPFRPGGFVTYNLGNRPSKAIVEYHGPNNPRNVRKNLLRRAKRQAGKTK